MAVSAKSASRALRACQVQLEMGNVIDVNADGYHDRLRRSDLQLQVSLKRNYFNPLLTSHSVRSPVLFQLRTRSQDNSERSNTREA